MTAKIIVTGAGGMLGQAVVKALEASEQFHPVPFTSEELDISKKQHLIDCGLFGETIINCAGIVRGRADLTLRRMTQVNAFAPHALAKMAHRLIHVSTDCVFDGTSGPYVESDEPFPGDMYGMTKLFGEIDFPPHLTVRTSFIGFGKHGLLRWLVSHPKGARVWGYRNWRWNGLYVRTVARELVRLLDSPMTGILHIEGPVIDKYELLSMVAKCIRPDLQVVPEITKTSKDLVLKSERIDWTNHVDPPFSWDLMMEELKADYKLELVSQVM